MGKNRKIKTLKQKYLLLFGFEEIRFRKEMFKFLIGIHGMD